MTIVPVRAALLAVALALLNPFSSALAQPNTPAVSREFTVFFGDSRAEAVTVPFTYSDIPLPTHAESRQFTYFAGELRLDAWSREASLQVLVCSEPVPPAVLEQPASAVICPLPLLPVAFSVVAQDDEPLVYLWQRFDPDFGDGWTPLTDGYIAGIGLVSGSQAATLEISGPVQPVLMLRVAVSNSCGTVLSQEVSLRICVADHNCDGVVNSTDISGYITAWLTSVQHGTLGADINGDGVVNSSDISAFITFWIGAVNGGC